MTDAELARRYTYIVSPTKEIDGEFVATCMELPGLSSIQESPAAALTDLIELVAAVIDQLRIDGETIPPPGPGR